MNRPNRNSIKYLMEEQEYFYTSYVNDLEAYCDELEDNAEVNNDCLKVLAKDNDKLEKALDKAYRFILGTQKVYGHEVLFPTKEQWMEWVLKDE